jgi:hypothetical protein
MFPAHADPLFTNSVAVVVVVVVSSVVEAVAS